MDKLADKLGPPPGEPQTSTGQLGTARMTPETKSSTGLNSSPTPKPKPKPTPPAERMPCGCVEWSEKQGWTLEHTCCTCHDAGRVLNPREHATSPFRLMLCPQCTGAAPNSEKAWEAARAEFRKRAHIPEGFANYRLDTFDPKPDGGAKSAAQRYAKSWPPSGFGSNVSSR